MAPVHLFVMIMCCIFGFVQGDSIKYFLDNVERIGQTVCVISFFIITVCGQNSHCCY